MAKMGLMIRDDPPKVIDCAARQWGEAKAGWALSVESTPGTEKDDPPTLSIVIRNVGTAKQTLTVPGWMHFYAVELHETNGTEVPMAPFGKTALDPSRRSHIEAEIAPGEWVETMIPLGSFFNVRGKPGLLATARATVAPGIELLSNTAPV